MLNLYTLQKVARETLTFLARKVETKLNGFLAAKDLARERAEEELKAVLNPSCKIEHEPDTSLSVPGLAPGQVMNYGYGPRTRSVYVCKRCGSLYMEQ